MRRRRAVLLLLVMALSLGGCWNRDEVNDLAIVAMIGLDQREDGWVELWVQLVLPEGAGQAPGQGGGGKPGPKFITHTASGRTILEASREIQLEVPRRLFWAHARVILLSERLARAGVRPVMDFLTRHPQLRMTNYVLVARGEMAEVMSAAVDLERLPSEHIREISRARVGVEVQIHEWVETLASTGAEPIMGAVEIIPPPEGASEGQHGTIRLLGTALFRRDRLVGFLDRQSTRGLLWLRDEIEQGVITIQPLGGDQSVSIVMRAASWVDRKARMENGRLVIDVRARMEGDITELQASLDLSQSQVVRQVEQELSREIARRMEAVLSELQSQSLDAAGLGEVVHRQWPGVWKTLEKDWLTRGFGATKVNIFVEAKVRRTGLTSKPLGVREEELNRGGEQP
ncbi:MAG: Ger(x)C family spore germination protein [Bacillota bacterium]